jgi:acetylcholinesterase
MVLIKQKFSSKALHFSNTADEYKFETNEDLIGGTDLRLIFFFCAISCCVFTSLNIVLLVWKWMRIFFVISGSTALMDRDIVLVTVNYRLAALGFLAMGTKEVPGNAGMKDQVLALKWIQKNIGMFGGNRNSVTLFGSSAGGYSVTSHMASPMSAKLFHRAIAMSGAVTSASKLQRTHDDSLNKFGEMLNCSRENILQCLKKVNNNWNFCVMVDKNLFVFRQHHTSLWKISRIVKSFIGDLWLRTTLDKRDFSQKILLNRFAMEISTEFLWSLVKPSSSSNHVLKVKTIKVVQLFLNIKISVITENTFATLLMTNFNRIACFYFNENANKSQAMSEKLRSSFLPDKTATFEGLRNLLSDGNIGYPVYKFVQLAANFTDVFYYMIEGKVFQWFHSFSSVKLLIFRALALDRVVVLQ